MLKAKVGHDGLFERLNIGTQLISMGTTTRKQLDYSGLVMGTQKIVKQQQLQLAKQIFIPEKSKFRRTKNIAIH